MYVSAALLVGSVPKVTRTLGENCGTLEDERDQRPTNSIKKIVQNVHVSTESDLVVGQAALAVARAERAHPIDDEAVVLDRRLEALEAVPYPTDSARYTHQLARTSRLTSHARVRKHVSALSMDARA